MPKVFISTSSFGRVSKAPLEALERAGCSYETNPHGRQLDSTEIRRFLSGAEGLVAGTEPLDRETLAGARDLRVISRVGTGLENIDLAAAHELDIRVANTPDPPAQAVAELVLGGILALRRDLCRADSELRRGSWQKPMGRLLSGSTVGVIGTGRAGKALVGLLAPFQCRILAFDLHPEPSWARDEGVEYTPIDALLAESDVVSLHVPLTEDTRGMIDGRRLASMKPGALLINCARGGLVDEASLAENLKNGRLGGAFLDVFETEPYQGDLIALPNTLLSPHIGSYAAECRLQMELEAVANLVAALGQTERSR